MKGQIWLIFYLEVMFSKTDGLPKDGFYWIVLYFSRSDRSEKGIIWGILPLFGNFIKMITILCIQLLGDGIDLLSRDGFYWIIQKVILKVRFGPFPHNYRYYSVLPKCIASCSFYGVKPIMSWHMKGMESFLRSERSNFDLC